MLDITVFNSHQHIQVRHAGLVSLVLGDHGKWQLIEPPDAACQGDHFECIPGPKGYTVAVGCQSDVRLANGETVKPGSRLLLETSLHLIIGQTHIALRNALHEPSPHRQLEPINAEQYRDARNPQQGGGPASATLGRWFEALATLHRWTANRAEFFDDAAQFLVDPVGLDGGMVLRCNAGNTGDHWRIVASHLPRPEFGVSFDVNLVEQAVNQNQTLFHPGHGDGQSVVVSPITNDQQEITGAVYAFRATHNDNGRRGVRYLEAQLVELLAQSVSCGVSRLASETQAARQRVTLERLFAPGVAEQVELDTTALTGTEREVTVLFADLRGFASLCERLSTADTYSLLNEVMDALTAAVMNHGGTLIDYYGDGLAAMWNAPVSQPHHPALACHAAFDMLGSLPEVSERWKQVLDKPLQLGIGVHTGIAQVGNIGSTQRLKYGPRGSTVNLASRLEQATKLLGTPLVVTREVAQQLDGQYIDFRVCQAELPGIEQPVDVFTIRPTSSDPQLLDTITRYEDALALYESGDLERAKELLTKLPQDAELPIEFLIGQIDREYHRRLGRRASDERAKHDTAAIQLMVK